MVQGRKIGYMCNGYGGAVKGESTLVRIRFVAAFMGCAVLALAASRAQAQSDLFLYVPFISDTSAYTTNAGGTLGAGTTIGGGGSTIGANAVVRGDQAFAYVTFSAGNTLQVVNTATQSVVQTVTTGAGPRGVTLSPNGSTLYVANNGGVQNTVFVYSVNAMTGILTQTATINTGARPRNLAVSPDGSTLYVVNQANNTLTAYSTATNTLTATVSVGNQPTYVALNPAGTVAYVTNASSQNVSVINTATNTVTATLNVGANVLSVAVSPNGQYFYVAATSGNQVSIFNANTNALVGTASSASTPVGIVISPDGSTLYVTNNGSANLQAFSINPSTGLLTSLGFFATGGILPSQPGMCGNGNGMLGSGGTFLATSNGALGCAGSSATMTGGTIVAGIDNLVMGTPIVLASQGGTLNTNGNNLTLGGAISGTGSFSKTGLGTLTLTGNSTYSGASFVNMGTLQAGIANAFSANSAYNVASGATLDLNGFNQSIGSLAGAGFVTLGTATLATGNDNTSTTFSGVISGTGGLAKIGTGTLTLTGNNAYSGGTTVSGGLINFSAAGNLGSGMITLAGGGLQWAAGTSTDISSRLVLGAGGGTIDTNGNNVSFANGLSGSGGLTKAGAGLLSLNGNNTYAGVTTVNAGGLVVNGSLAGGVIVNAGGMLGGNGSFGGLVSNGGLLAPGNSIGTFTVNGNFAQNGGIYQVEANAQGQSDRINVGGTATVSSGATVQVLAQPGIYGKSTTYTILRANGGLSGTYSGVSSNFAFLTPSLGYDANDVFLTLSMADNAFSFGGRTYNQRQVGRTLDQTFGSASGDYATVLTTIVGLSTSQGPQILDMISGQQYAGFANAMVQGAQLFMSNFANRAGSGSTAGARVALAEACDVACDATTPARWGAWGGAMGGTGTIAGNDNAGTFTYSVGGFSGGLDRKITDNVLAGVTVGYQTGGQWTGGFDGRSATDTFQAGLYASFVQGPVYVDALAGYAYSANQMWRNINIPGLQPRTAYGQAGANQFLGQIEAGYRVDLGGAPGYFVTPFALLQGSTANQNGFTETGAQSLNLNVAQQTTGSLRSILGAQLGASMDVGLRDKIAAQLRFGWSHEYADTARPVTATFTGAPVLPFTVFGAAPTRDGAVIGVSASTAIADAMGLYLRYEGTLAGQDSSHALTAGLRMTW
jgi:autotransporter-associated beta strand protein/YVTN family beta-propeller protein